MRDTLALQRGQLFESHLDCMSKLRYTRVLSKPTDYIFVLMGEKNNNV
jgi:hypothetical protein